MNVLIIMYVCETTLVPLYIDTWKDFIKSKFFQFIMNFQSLRLDLSCVCMFYLLVQLASQPASQPASQLKSIIIVNCIQLINGLRTVYILWLQQVFNVELIYFLSVICSCCDMSNITQGLREKQKKNPTTYIYSQLNICCVVALQHIQCRMYVLR